MSIWQYANPVKFINLARKIRHVTDPLSGIAIATALFWAMFFLPEDYRQGHTVKIMYVHVPAAFLGINAWFAMVAGSMIWFIRRHHVSALVAKAAAPVGLTFTMVALITGAIWGKPMWGTYWAWDPQLTSFFILFLSYIGYIALWSAIEDENLAADMTAILSLVGGLFAVISRYAVDFWNQGLHQAASLSLDKEEHLANVFYFPLLLSIFGFFLLFISLVLYRTETEILKRRLETLLARSGDDDV